MSYPPMDRAALDLQYNARATVPDIAPMLHDYASISAQARATLPCTLNLAYGPHPDETLDIFPAQGNSPGPVLIYLHGGYWRLLSKDDSSFMAPTLTQAGITVVAVNYSLAPAVTLDHIGILRGWYLQAVGNKTMAWIRLR
jgi:arylformamidase